MGIFDDMLGGGGDSTSYGDYDCTRDPATWGMYGDGSGGDSSGGATFDPGTDSSYNQPPQVITTDANGAQEQRSRGTGATNNTNDSFGPFGNALAAVGISAAGAWARYGVDKARAQSGLAPDFYATGQMMRDPRTGNLVPVLPGSAGYRAVGSMPNGTILLILGVVVLVAMKAD